MGLQFRSSAVIKKLAKLSALINLRSTPGHRGSALQGSSYAWNNLFHNHIILFIRVRQSIWIFGIDRQEGNISQLWWALQLNLPLTYWLRFSLRMFEGTEGWPGDERFSWSRLTIQKSIILFHRISSSLLQDAWHFCDSNSSKNELRQMLKTTSFYCWNNTFMNGKTFVQWFQTGVPCTKLRDAARQCGFQYIIEKMISKCGQTSNLIAMGSPLGAANYISLMWSAATLKTLGT